ncbi:hypothetical protein XA68_18443 [Ophiocordyceps unilateralis]|uniref:Uncharacterized protein n=1 Tax=Ophiocordyceps unilateralis TaxID=268505 RepID=A0A2A9P3A4_OPHUN|nr:hypothetical protein XA68_18443 [Ophiocordyceps unilateralis]
MLELIMLLLSVTLCLVPGVISSPPQQPPTTRRLGSWEVERNSEGDPFGLTLEKPRLPSAPRTNSVPLLEPLLFKATSNQVEVHGESSPRPPTAAIKKTLHPPTVAFCQNSRYRGFCDRVVLTRASYCYQVPRSLRWTVSSIQLINVVGKCWFFKQFNCQDESFDTSDSIGTIWKHHGEFQNNIRSFYCIYPLPLLYQHTRFTGRVFAVDVPLGYCADVPPPFDNAASSFSIPEDMYRCLLFPAHGCRGDYLEAYEDIAEISAVSTTLNDAIGSILCSPQRREPLLSALLPQFTPEPEPAPAPVAELESSSGCVSRECGPVGEIWGYRVPRIHLPPYRQMIPAPRSLLS